MVAEREPATKLLVFNSASGSLTEDVQRRLTEAFPAHFVVAVRPGEDVAEAYGSCLATEDAEVVVAGGDGTVEALARCVAGTRRRLAIIPMGTFNNFARALDIPLDLDRAISVALHGEARPVTIGWVDDRPFLEAAAIGVFGDLLGVGETAKEMHFGEFLRQLREVRGEPFRYVVRGDVHLRGRAESMVFANTPTIGALIALADTTPTDPSIQLEVIESHTRFKMARRFVSGLLRRPGPPVNRLEVRSVRVATTPPVRVHVDAFEAGETPVTIRAEPGGLTVMLPRR